MGRIRDEIKLRLSWMGYDMRDIALMIPIQTIWAAIEGIDDVDMSQQYPDGLARLTHLPQEENRDGVVAFVNILCGKVPTSVGYKMDKFNTPAFKQMHIDEMFDILRQVGFDFQRYGTADAELLAKMREELTRRIEGLMADIWKLNMSLPDTEWDRFECKRFS